MRNSKTHMSGGHWDVIVIGAGPAGLALARGLNLKCPDWRVLVLERNHGLSDSPRIGESLPGSARVLLHELKVFDKFMLSPHNERGAAVAIWDMESPIWQDSLVDPNGPGWHLDRNAYEQMFLRAAKDSGTTIYWHLRQIKLRYVNSLWNVTAIDQNNQSVECSSPIIIDASGRKAHAAKQCGVVKVANDPLLCAYTFLPLTQQDMDSTTRIAAAKEGWWYSVQTCHGRILAYHFDRDRSDQVHLQNSKAFIDEACSYGLLGDVLSGYPTRSLEAVPLQYRAAGGTSLNFEQLQQLPPGFLAIGDALLSFDPIASQGLFHALASAHSACQCILDGFPENVSAASRYYREMTLVKQRYHYHWHHTYCGPKRFSQYPFWQRRISAFKSEPSEQVASV